MIASPDSSSPRIFPTIRSDIYSMSQDLTELTPDQHTARKLLTFANKEFTKWERLVGWKLDEVGQIGRLLLQHRLAMEAELAAQWERADFFWNQVQIELKLLSKRDDVWQAIVLAVANEPGVVVMRDPIQLRQRVVDELFIDTHQAFYHGLVQRREHSLLRERAFIHVDHIQKLLNLQLSARSEDDLILLIGIPRQPQISSYIRQGNWQQAIQLCSNRLKYIPNSVSYQTELAEIYFLSIVAKLSETSLKTSRSNNFQIWQEGIGYLEQLCKEYPSNLSIFELISYLHYWHATRLVQDDQLSEGLVAVQKALTYNSYLDRAAKIRNDLLKQMLESSQTDKHHSRTPLTKSKEKLRVQASQGIKLRDAYIHSSAAKTTASAFQQAQTGKVFTPKYPGFTELDCLTIEELHTHKLFGFWNQHIVEPAPVSPSNSTVLIPRLIKGRADKYPLVLWLCSRQSNHFRFWVAVAAFLILFAGVVTFRESSLYSARNVAYQHMLEAEHQGNYIGVVQGAEAFLSNTSLSGKDARHQEVMHLYSKALVLQFWQEGNQPTGNIQVRLERYRTVMNKSNK